MRSPSGDQRGLEAKGRSMPVSCDSSPVSGSITKRSPSRMKVIRSAGAQAGWPPGARTSSPEPSRSTMWMSPPSSKARRLLSADHAGNRPASRVPGVSLFTGAILICPSPLGQAT